MRLRRSLAAILAAVALTAGFVDAAAAGPARKLLVYYANETTERALRSDAYAVLLAALARSAAPAAGQLSFDLREDARLFPEAVARDVAALSEAARRLDFDLAVFTNALAQEGRFLLLRGAAEDARPLPFPQLPPAANPILAASPLARGDALRAALAAAAAAYPAEAPDAVLITNSHGAGDLAIVPRVFADLSNADPADVLAAFEGAPRAGSARTAAAEAQGMSKREYWRILGEGEAVGGLRFGLVFRQACESGVSSWAELGLLPDGVAAIAHTAAGRIAYGDVDYARVFAADGLAGRLGEHMAPGLRSQGIHVDSPGRMWTWLARDAAAAALPYLLFAPLVAWLAWYARRCLVAARPRAVRW